MSAAVSMPRRRVTAAAPTLREWLRDEPFALALSSGFFGFFAHAGLMTVLEDEGLLPARLSGASAGALVAALWASGLSATAMRDKLLRLERADFGDPAPGPGLLRGRLFRARLEAAAGVPRFEEARAPVTVSVFDLATRRTRVVDRGPLAAAIQASCAVPFLFRPVWLEGRPCIDGGVADRPGIAGLPDGTRTLFHHLASRSPWRFALPIPERRGLTALVLPGLPRVGPFRLGEGARAFEAARRRTRDALDLEVAREVLTA